MEDKMKIPYIDFRNLKYPIKETIEKELDRVLTGEIKHVKIKHIPSSVFCDATGCKPYDYNGWQCDWWGNFEYRGYQFEAAGCAWYGTVVVELEK